MFFLCENGIIKIRAREISRKEGTHLPARYIINGVTVGGYDMETKKCRYCYEVKPFSEFHNSKIMKDGKKNKCKYCVRKEQFEKRYGVGCEVPAKSVYKRVKLTTLTINGEKREAKECTECGEVLVLERFPVHKTGLGGRDSKCMSCVYKKVKVWNANNKERVRKNARERVRKQRAENPEFRKKQIENQRKSYQKHKLKRREECKRYLSENRDIIRKRHREFYHENKEEVTKRWREYYKSPKGQIASKRASHKRREAEKGSLSTLTSSQWKECKKHFNNCCAYCGNENKMTMDHFHPVSKGGELTVKNVLPTCPSCNYSKRDKDFFDWYPSQPFYSKQRERKILKYLDIKDNEQQIALF